jgi:hypothetical protein
MAWQEKREYEIRAELILALSAHHPPLFAGGLRE